jgi:hypothetical protein
MGTGTFGRNLSINVSSRFALRSAWRIGLIVALAIVPGRMARAGAPALGFFGSPENNAVGNFTVGWEFTVTGPVTVDGLGYWDRLADGLGASHAVALWTGGGTLVTSATVPSGTSGTLIDSFRYVPIAPTPLLAGTYVIGGYANGDIVANQAVSISTIPEINFVQNRGTTASSFSLAFPTGTFPAEGQGFFGANFTVEVVPEPAGFAVLGIAACALALRRRRT